MRLWGHYKKFLILLSLSLSSSCVFGSKLDVIENYREPEEDEWCIVSPTVIHFAPKSEEKSCEYCECSWKDVLPIKTLGELETISGLSVKSFRLGDARFLKGEEAKRLYNQIIACENLETLCLAGINLEGWDLQALIQGALRHLEKLKVLDLSGNNLSSVSLSLLRNNAGYFKGLREVVLKGDLQETEELWDHVFDIKSLYPTIKFTCTETELLNTKYAAWKRSRASSSRLKPSRGGAKRPITP